MEHTRPLRTVVVSAPDPSRPLSTHASTRDSRTLYRQVWLSLLWSHCSFLGSWWGTCFVCASKSFAQSCGSSIIKYHWLSKSNSGDSQSLCWISQVKKSLVALETFATVQELVWYNCSPVHGSSAQWLYSGTNGDLLQEDLCLTPCHPGLMQPQSPCLRGGSLLTRASAGDTQTPSW